MDLQAIRKKIDNTENIVHDGTYHTKQFNEHSGTIMDTLKGDLADTTIKFAKVLEVRTEVRILKINY